MDRAQTLANGAIGFETGKFELEALNAQQAEKKPDFDKLEQQIVQIEKENKENQ